MNTSTRLFIVFLLLQTSFSTFAQIDFKHFPIDSFKLPSIHWTALELGGSIIGNYNYGHNKGFESGNNSSYFSPQLSLQYSGFINRPDLQASYSVSTSPYYSARHDKSASDNVPTFDRYFSPDAHLDWTQRKYHNRSFFLIGLNADAVYYSRSQRTINQNNISVTTKHTNFNGSISVPIGFGTGRLETVSDVTMSLFLLQDAVGIGLDPNSLHHDDVVAFSELMANVRNQRVFDDRRKRVYELRSLYNFMLSKGWVLHDDPGFFTLLTDNWLYNFNSSRYSGNRWTYLLTPVLGSNSEILNPFDQFNSQIKNQSYGGKASVEYQHYRQQSLYRSFRRSHSIEIGANENKEKSQDMEINYSVVNGLFSNSIGYGWFPNTRTEITTDLYLTYQYSNSLQSPDLALRRIQNTVNTALFGQCHYFLSYKAQLNIIGSISYFYNMGSDIRHIEDNFFHNDRGSNIFSANFNASITVFLF